MNKQLQRKRRLKRTRMKIRELRMPRICVRRSGRHMHAQVIAADGAQVLAAASTLDKTLRADIDNGSNVEAAKRVGQLLASRAKEAGVLKVAFDRSGYRYHGRVKALAEAAREGGMEF